MNINKIAWYSSANWFAEKQVKGCQFNQFKKKKLKKRTAGRGFSFLLNHRSQLGPKNNIDMSITH